MPSALRPAPSPTATPLPGSFTLTEDASTREFDGGTVLLGGSPLRLFRISERAGRLVERWRSGQVVGPGRGSQLLARRLVSAGAFVPQATGGALGDDDVTVVVPVRDRPAQLDRLLGALSGLACIVVDDASADAGATKEIAERHGARFVGLTTNVGPAGARERGDGTRAGRARRVRGFGLRPGRRVAGATAGSVRRPVGGGGGAAHRLAAPVAPPVTRRRVRHSTGGTEQGRCGHGAPSLSCPAPPCLCARTSHWAPTSSTPRCAAARTWTWCGAWARPAGTCAMCHRARSPTRARRHCEPSWPAAPSTGRPPRRWPGVTARPSLPCICPAGRWRCGPWCWPAGPCSR